ncbi:gamma-glutamyltransferase family protein [Rubrobacter aplysinae]|uniref:gamma-glutamyltransferase family protein n=1 Tax=Rubrobacter aplysinae TaxID=909625 RepID=UPI00064C0780|nr:gamma-glutamyltransferase [Rubrobacter aplysinae]
MEDNETVGATRFAAAAGTPYAAGAATEIYHAGGNAADAAVAAAAAVGVTEPLMSSIGGGGFALVRPPGGVGKRAELVDYYDAMPGKGLPQERFGSGGWAETKILKYGAGIRSTVGAASCAVPGALRGWETLLRRHGRLTLRETLAPATRLAREGFYLCRTSALWLVVAEEVLRLTDETRRTFYTRDSGSDGGERVYREGEEVRFPELARTLEAVGERGADYLYRGELGRRVSEYVLGMGGIITQRDLEEYEAVVREPLTVGYGRGEIHTNGPPSAGGPTLAQMLRVLSGQEISTLPDEDYAALVAGAMRLALADRATAYTDGAENLRVAGRLTGEEYAEAQRRKISEGFGSPHTTHLSCVDESGLAVSITQSMGYGSGLVVPGTGIPMGNTLGEPELNPRGFHALSPGERLISSMSPTVVSSEAGGIVALGSPGASRIPTAILQTLVGVLDHDLPLAEAVRAPRFHAEDLPEGSLLAYEAGSRAASATAGYDRILSYDGPDMYFGGVNAVRLTPEGEIEAAADPRRSGGTAFV